MDDTEYLVTVRWHLPPDLVETERVAVLEAERTRGRQLMADRVIRRIWRLPGKTANVGIWAAASPTQLHDYISSLPLFPWAQVTVTPLAVHPLEAAAEASAGADARTLPG